MDIVIDHFYTLSTPSTIDIDCVCLESANQNSVLSAAIIYLSLDQYDDDEIDLAIGIPIMYTLIACAFDGMGGLFCCQMKWVHCHPPGDVQSTDEDGEDETVTFSHFLHRYRLWKQQRRQNS